MAKKASEKTDREFISEWQNNIKKAYEPISRKSEEWKEFRRLWRSQPPEPSGSKDEEEFRANTFVAIVRPLIDTFAAKELIYFLGYPGSMTYQVVGKERKKFRWLEDRMQKTMNILWNQAYRYGDVKGTVSDAYNYGIAGMEVRPAENPYDVFELYSIRPWDFLFDQVPVKWRNVGWAGHEKVSTKEYLKKKGYDNIDKISNLPLMFDKPVYRLDAEGVLVTTIWDKETEQVITFGNRNTILRKIKFPYDFPYVVRKTFTETNQMWAEGLTFLVQWVQYYATLMRNHEIDIALRMIPAWLVPNTVAMEDMEFLIPGRPVEWMGGEKPQEIGSSHSPTELKIDIAQMRREAETTVGLPEIAQGIIPSKRMTKAELVMSQQNIGGGRFWDIIKEAESDFYLPLQDKIMNIMATKAPDDLFDKFVKPMNAVENPIEYVIAGHLSPRDIKKYGIQVKSTMSRNIMQNEEELQRLFLFLRTIASIDPNRLKAGETLTRMAEEINVAGISDLIKSDQEYERDMQQVRKQMAAEVAQIMLRGAAGGGGTGAPQVPMGG